MVSFPPVSPPKSYTPPSPQPYAPHTQTTTVKKSFWWTGCERIMFYRFQPLQRVAMHLFLEPVTRHFVQTSQSTATTSLTIITTFRRAWIVAKNAYYLHVRPSVRPHVSVRLKLGWFPYNLINFYINLSRIYELTYNRTRISATPHEDLCAFTLLATTLSCHKKLSSGEMVPDIGKPRRYKH